ncbi:MAG: hypothetical protein AAFP97_10470, partial [Pseudomonadota bacterium]
MMFRSFLISALFCLPCGTVWADYPGDPERAKMLGDYVSGSYARYLNDPRAQSRFFQGSFENAPEDVRLGRLALYSALFSDDQKLALQTARKLYKTDNSESMARAVLAVDAFSKGRSARVRRYASDPTVDFTMGLAMQIVLGWNQIDEGRYEAARETFSSLSETEYFGRLGQLQLAKMEGRLGNVEAATEIFDDLELSGVTALELTLARARFEAANGMKERARARLQTLIDDNSAAQIGPAGEYLDRLKQGKRLPRLSERAEAARALTDPAFSFFVRNKS